MSRIGTTPIVIPSNVSIQQDGERLVVEGPKGKLEIDLRPEMKTEITAGRLVVLRKKQDRIARSMHGLTRSLVNNMVIGVTQGWRKDLELVGVGYRAQGGGDALNLSVGYSHQVQIKAPGGITFSVTDNTKIAVLGIDKSLVGQVAANIRSIKPPEVYKGKGIRYAGEYVRRKPGKTGKVGAKQ